MYFCLKDEGMFPSSRAEGRGKSSWEGSIVLPASLNSVPWPVTTTEESAACMGKGDLDLKWRSQGHTE